MADQKDDRLKVQVWIYSRDSRGEVHVLLLKTISERGGFWQPVTGGVEEGESPDAAASREAVEETGLPFKGDPKALNYEFSFDGRWGKARESVYAYELPKDAHEKLKPRIDPTEHTAYRWLPASQADALLRFDSNKEGLRRLLGSV